MLSCGLVVARSNAELRLRGRSGATRFHVVSAWQARGETHVQNCRGAFWKLEA